MKILYIEDDATAALTIERISMLLKCDVQIAETGAKGLAQLDSNPDIVLVDMQLPDYDGLTLIRKIRGVARSRVYEITDMSDSVGELAFKKLAVVPSIDKEFDGAPQGMKAA